MSAIDSYIKQTAKKYPRTKEVAEQLEEIRDTLHIKTEEYQAQGLGQEEAAQSAIHSIGDIRALMSGVAGESRVVYVNRLWAHVSFISMIIITVEAAAALLIACLPIKSAIEIFLWPPYPPELYYVLHNLLRPFVWIGISPKLFWPMFIPCLIVLWSWPITALIMRIRQPGKIQSIELRSKQLVTTALIGWAVSSFTLYLLNVTTDAAFWVWGIVFISNWPLIIWSYSRQLKSGRYDA